MPKEKLSDLAAAAMGYEQELRRFEELAAAARRTKLTSERNLTRAAEALQKASESQQKILEHVQRLVQAMTAGRADQEREAQALVELGQRIHARRARYGELFQKMADLGAEAKDIHGLLTGAPSKEVFDTIRDRMEAAAKRAEEIAGEARTDEMEDLERQADSLQKQLLSARNRLQLLASRAT